MNKSWDFMKHRPVGSDTAEINVRLTDEGLYAIADDDFYYGDLGRDGSLELARAVVDYAPVKAVVLERDENFPAASEWKYEVAKLERLRVRD